MIDQCRRGILDILRLSHLRWALMIALISLCGVLYTFVFDMRNGHVVAMVFANFCTMPLIVFERGFILRGLHARIRRLPTPTYFLSTILIYFVLAGLGFAAAGVLLKGTGQIAGSWEDVLIIPPKTLAYTLILFFLGISVMRIRQLLGRDVFLSLLTGRYRRPIQEERIFLFIDLAGSTSYAETFGDLKAQEFIGAIFGGICEPVIRHGGTIDDYVGDAAIITWPLHPSRNSGRCDNAGRSVACVFDILAQIEADAARWQEKYGRVPQLRAALHGGSVVTAEIGVDHHKITYFGDVVNTTARLEALCKSVDRPVLMSSDLFDFTVLPTGIRAEPLGTYMLKGRDQPLGVVALEKI